MAGHRQDGGANTEAKVQSLLSVGGASRAGLSIFRQSEDMTRHHATHTQWLVAVVVIVHTVVQAGGHCGDQWVGRQEEC